MKKKPIKKPSLSGITKKLPSAEQIKQKVRPGSTSADKGVPRITSQSIAEHREEVLGSARKYIYPLRHSRHRIVKISIILFVVAIVGFFAACVLSLYKLQTTSQFMYAMTKIIPFPVAKVDHRFVSYEDYLFELRHFMHYYESQQNSDFSTKDGQLQLERFKKTSMNAAINHAYVKQLAKEHNLSVSAKEVNEQIELVRAQNRLGASDQVFRNVLREFWGWSVSDFKRELHNELLEQKVIAALDTETAAQANVVLAKLQAGADFKDMAAKYSDDEATRDKGGEYGFTISQNSRDISPKAVAALYALQKDGQLTDVINAGYHLEIDKLLKRDHDKLQAAHITFMFKDIDTYLAPEKREHPAKRFLNV